MIHLKVATPENIESVRERIIKALEEKNLTQLCSTPEPVEVEYHQQGLHIYATKAVAYLIAHMAPVSCVKNKVL